jgi:hypothetical protein
MLSIAIEPTSRRQILKKGRISSGVIGLSGSTRAISLRLSVGNGGAGSGRRGFGSFCSKGDLGSGGCGTGGLGKNSGGK